MNNLQWYHYALLILGIAGVCLGPWVFTHPYPYDWDFLDFSQTGSIGDTIGGITAPFIGLLSIVLLVWTLNEQIKINKEQKRFNDESRILSMQTQIMQLNDNIRFGYSSFIENTVGGGCSSLRNLQRGTPAKVTIPYDELMALIQKVHILDVAVCSLINVTNEADLKMEEKKSTLAIALFYIDDILHFYDMVESEQIDFLLPLDNAGSELISLSIAQSNLKGLTKSYSLGVHSSKGVCDQYFC